MRGKGVFSVPWHAARAQLGAPRITTSSRWGTSSVRQDSYYKGFLANIHRENPGRVFRRFALEASFVGDQSLSGCKLNQSAASCLFFALHSAPIGRCGRC